eukprot:154740-Lingulodinium_polyedra.AAC.1
MVALGVAQRPFIPPQIAQIFHGPGGPGAFCCRWRPETELRSVTDDPGCRGTALVRARPAPTT